MTLDCTAWQMVTSCLPAALLTTGSSLSITVLPPHPISLAMQ